MPLIFGLLALGLALSLTALWWSTAFVAALQVLCVCGLFLFGFIWSVVGYSELKAARELASAREEPLDAPAPSDTQTADPL